MNNTEKLLRAFIEAKGFDVEENKEQISCTCRHNALTLGGDVNCPVCYVIGYNFNTDYKVTKRDGRSKLHRVVREYEAGNCSVSEMINEIEKIVSIQ